ncbi:MAG: 16S rRNA processing protein RimM [Firmicutes bacterium]|nr:16S rRNA processing protein RimM [Bacillota bacterium]
MENTFLIGKIVNTQGVHGEMRVIPTTDDITRFELLSSVFIDDKEYEIERVRYHKQFVLLKLKGIDDMTAAERYKTKEVRIPEDWALPCGEDEYYIKDLYGMKVVDEENNELGVIKDIMFTGANDVYIVKPKTGKEILIPAIKECILDVDTQNKTMRIHLMEGLAQ